MKKTLKKIVSIAAICIVGGAASAISIRSVLHARRYSGTVRDGATGSPAPSVAVSNGRDVVLTDENGRYSLNGWSKARFITVSVPSGYWSENYYIPVSKAKTGYDFYLDKLSADLTDHTFLQVTDSEVGAAGAGDWVDKVRETAAETRPAFIIHTGDICYIDGLKAHIKDMNTENMGVPVRYIIGNHDYVEWGDYGEALFESVYGPTLYSFEVGKIHYVCSPIASGDAKARYTKKDVARFIRNDLKRVSPDKKVVVFNHTYCEDDETGFALSYGVGKVDLRKRNLLAWVFGHLHYNYLNETDGVFNITVSRPDCGGIDASPSSIRSVRIKGGTLESSDLYFYNFRKIEPPSDFVWSASLDENILYSDPLLCDGVLYVGTVDDGYPKDCAVVALDAGTGVVLWRYKTKNSIKSEIRRAGDRLVAQDIEGNVYCLGLDGGEIWTRKLDLLHPSNSSNGIAADGERVYCGGQRRVFCLNASDGEEIWNKEIRGGDASPSGFVLNDGALIVGSHWNKLVAFNKLNGKKLWENKENGLSFIVPTPAVYDGNIFISSGGALYKIDARTGKTTLYKEYEDYTFNSATTPYIENGIMYTGSTDRGVVAVDIENLEILWTFKTGKNLVHTDPYASGDISTVDSAIVPFGENLCFGASDGRLYIVDKNGAELRRYNIGSPVNQAPAVNGNDIVACDLSGNVVCVKVD